MSYTLVQSAPTPYESVILGYEVYDDGFAPLWQFSDGTNYEIEGVRCESPEQAVQQALGYVRFYASHYDVPWATGVEV